MPTAAKAFTAAGGFLRRTPLSRSLLDFMLGGGMAVFTLKGDVERGKGADMGAFA